MGRVDLGWRNGRRQTKTIYRATRRAVAEAVRDELKAAQVGTLIADERQTLGAFLARWLQDVARPRLRPRTFVGYEAAIARHVEPHLAKVRLAKLTPQTLQAWMATLETNGVPAGRRRYARVVLRTALNTAMKWRLVTINAATLVDAPRATRREIHPLSPDQAKLLLVAAQKQPLEAFVTVGLGCGLRLGEVLGLKWEDVDLEAATLSVRRAVQRFGGDAAARRPLLAERKRLATALKATPRTSETAGDRADLARRLAEVRQAIAKVKTSVQVAEPKSARSHRTIALPAIAVVALRAHRVRQLEGRLAAGGAWQDLGFVFASGIGTPLDPRNVTREFKALLASADLPPIRLHDLRHSCASLLLAQGVNPRVVMETLGHSQISLTLNTYSHVLPALQHDAAARINAVLAGS
jgi:integrase